MEETLRTKFIGIWASLVLLSIGLLWSGYQQRSLNKDMLDNFNGYAQRDADLSNRLDEVEKQIATIQEALKLHNQLSAQQAEADEMFLDFMKVTNARLAKRE